MEPLLSYGDLELTLVELILGAALLLLGAIIAIIFSRRGNGQLEGHLSQMTERQTELQGRLAQMAEDSASRETLLRESLDTRLSKVSERVGQSIEQTQTRNSESLKQLHERLALIDRAQKNIETLSGEVSGLQSLLSNKQSRGAFGEKQMQDIISNFLPPNAYTFQHTLSNRSRVDAIIHLPDEHGDLTIDSKFPMEAWQRLTDAENSSEKESAKKAFAKDMLYHIKAISEKYIIFGETQDLALLFLPSEAIFTELQTNFQQVIDKSFAQKVMIVSPTTFMAAVHTVQSIMKDAAMREQAHIIQREVGMIAKDVTLLDDRVAKLQSHFNQSTDDIRKIRISTEKITKRADKIENLDVSEPKADSNITDFRKPSLKDTGS